MERDLPPTRKFVLDALKAALDALDASDPKLVRHHIADALDALPDAYREAQRLQSHMMGND